MIRLFCPVRITRLDELDATPVDHVMLLAGAADDNKRGPTRVSLHSDGNSHDFFLYPRLCSAIRVFTNFRTSVAGKGLSA